MMILDEIENVGFNIIHDNVIQNTIVNAIIEKKEEILKSVLKQLLHRDPVIEDAKRCTLFKTPQNIDIEIITFDGIRVGSIITKYNATSVMVKFIPYWTK
jgi:hypothetical protein